MNYVETRLDKIGVTITGNRLASVTTSETHYYVKVTIINHRYTCTEEAPKS